MQCKGPSQFSVTSCIHRVIHKSLHLLRTHHSTSISHNHIYVHHLRWPAHWRGLCTLHNHKGMAWHRADNRDHSWVQDTTPGYPEASTSGPLQVYKTKPQGQCVGCRSSRAWKIGWVCGSHNDRQWAAAACRKQISLWDFAMWHDHSTICGCGYIMVTCKEVYNSVVHYTSAEYKELTGEWMDILSQIERPYLHILAAGSSSGADHMAFTADWEDCLKNFNATLQTQEGTEVTDVLRFFNGDKVAQWMEAVR